MLTTLLSLLMSNVVPIVGTLLVNEIVKVLPIKSNSLIELAANGVLSGTKAVVDLITPKTPTSLSGEIPVMANLVDQIAAAIVKAEQAKAAASK